MKTNKLLAILLAIITAFSIFTITTVAADSADTVQMGKNIIGTYNADHTVLTISGSGEMWDHRYIKDAGEDYEIYSGKVELDREKIEQIIFDKDSKITSIGAYMFESSKLETVVIPDSVKKIKEHAFAYCKNLKNVDLGKVEAIEKEAFAEFNQLTSITLPKELKTLSSSPFANCTQLKTVNIGESKIDYSYIINAFRGRSNLKNYTVSEKNTKYTAKDGILFNKAMTKLIHAPMKFNKNGYKIPSTVTKICSYAFNCSSITSIVLNEKLEAIAPGAFEYSSLSSISLTKNIKKICKDVFYGSKIKKISVGTCEATGFAGATEYANRIESFTVSKNNKVYSAIDGVLYNKEQTKVIRYPSSKSGTTYKLPKTVKYIGTYSFTNNRTLESLTALGEIKSVGSHAFRYTNKGTQLKKLTFNNTKTAPTFGKGCLFGVDINQIVAQNKTVAKSFKEKITSADTDMYYSIKVYCGKEVVCTIKRNA